MFERIRFRKGLAAAVAGLLAVLGAGGVAIAQSGGSTSSSTGAKAAEAAEPNEQAETPGTEQESKAETPGTEQESKAEKADDDGPGGHADEPSNPNADHQAEGAE